MRSTSRYLFQFNKSKPIYLKVNNISSLTYYQLVYFNTNHIIAIHTICAIYTAIAIDTILAIY